MSADSAAVERQRQLDEVNEIFDREINPRLAAHLGGGNVLEIDDDGVVHVEFTGACTTCAYRRNTIVGAIYPRLREVDGVTAIASPGVTLTLREQQRVAAMFKDHRSVDSDTRPAG
jgi:Fe-S cluster biogenesis protein NfuA